MVNMAYPGPIPILKGKDAEEFFQRLETLRMTARQRRLYRGAIKFYEDLRPNQTSERANKGPAKGRKGRQTTQTTGKRPPNDPQTTGKRPE